MSEQVTTPVAHGDKLLHRLRKNLRAGWMRTFPQKSTRERAIELLITLLVVQTGHTIAAAAIYDGKDQDKNWTPPYRIFSNSSWSERELFFPCLKKALSMLPKDSKWCSAPIDDTKQYKTGKKIPDTSYQRDPMSPPFHTNLRLSHRFLHVTVVLPVYRHSPDLRARAIPVRFKLSPVLKKLGKKATKKQKAKWKEEKKTKNLSVDACKLIKEIRQDMDCAGYPDKNLLILGDGGFCNRRIFSGVGQTKRTHLLARARKDAVLAMPAPEDSRKTYDVDKFTPEQVRLDDKRPWECTTAAYAGRVCEIQFKRIDNLLWQRGAQRTPLTLFVLKPLPYKPTPNGPRYYRDPAYLLTTATDIPSEVAIQAYLDRWQIEVAHRELKNDLGVGKAHVRNSKSVRRLPAAIAAAYAMMNLTAIEVHGPTRTNDYRPLPAWRRHQARPSCRDITNLLATQLQQERAAPDYRHPVTRTRPPVPPRPKLPAKITENVVQAT